ncbi:hypothetical protein [Mucilaginibacter defluvii]|uniref:Uncharacterized protein n=1 Tax=Mucilaginibacter defluvii TaxID=1196019 RepID=A0ABP9FP04_9SPHI
MKKIRMAVAALAILGAIAPNVAFKKASPNALYTFVRVSGSAGSTNAADYEYRPTAECDQLNNNICKALWSQTSAPTAAGQHPTGTFNSVSDRGNVILNP